MRSLAAERFSCRFASRFWRAEPSIRLRGSAVVILGWLAVPKLGSEYDEVRTETMSEANDGLGSTMAARLHAWHLPQVSR